ncbi:TlpA disulfide reductase family protein [Nannocystis radixulma]|uniref:TlpA disulfide reductase family protein n=1 Tax=Nannocystis radixulma TaxID=2995305 RepID=A0ABT5B3F6_9BACT|nr:TlpA disulfide reductase family protein [Nannocystis radixulma]MDC0668649.1 TlpA disulfide reductase family protein [Nannocystis radixulma]
MNSRTQAARMRTLGLAVLSTLGACRAQDPSPGPGPAVEVQPTPAPAVAEATQDDDGEQRAVAAGTGLIGRPAPAITLTTIDGQPIDLARLIGKKPVYLKFWATWCVPCREQMPGFAEIHTKMADRIEVIAVNTGFTDDEAAVRAFRQEFGLKMPVVIDDGRLAEAFNLRVTPQHVLIGRDGRIAHIGHLADARLDEALRAALADDGQAPAANPTATGPDARPLAPGDLVRDLSLTADGKAVSLGGVGKPSALVFFAPWCESYLAESRPATATACRRVREQVEALAAKGDVHWLGVSSNLWTSERELDDYRTTTGTKFPLALDTSGAVFRAFGVREIPAVAVLDAAGRLVRVLGPQDQDIAAALAAASDQKTGGPTP